MSLKVTSESHKHGKVAEQTSFNPPPLAFFVNILRNHSI